jgi:hypothetical protein
MRDRARRPCPLLLERRLVERLDTRAHGERNLGDARRFLNLVENANSRW